MNDIIFIDANDDYLLRMDEDIYIIDSNDDIKYY